MKKSLLLFLSLFFSLIALSQNKVISGKVTDGKTGQPVEGANVIAKGTLLGTATNASGSFSFEVPANTRTITISFLSYESVDVNVSANNNVDVKLNQTTSRDNDVVVIGYGTARKKDLTGSVGTVSAKNFNKGISPAPDQLIQGKLAGVQVINNSGAPGAGTTIRIRGASSVRSGNTPLFVIDGVPLSNTNSRPDIGLTGDIGGGTPSGNPMNFINPADIASIDVLKDASAAAIYGSRGANGVVLITTKKGQAGAPKIDFNASFGTSSLLKKLEVLTGDEYRTALGQFGFPTTVSTSGTPTPNFGTSTKALDAILRKGFTQNYGVGISAGNESAKYRLSFGYLDQQGIIKKTDYKKYSANFSSTVKMLNSKKLTVDFNVITSQTLENIAPISNNAGYRGSLIGQALQWNPTKSLFKPDGSLLIEYGSDNINPLAYSTAYNDYAKVTTALVNVSPSYKISKNLEFKTQMSVNYSTGVRKEYTSAFINLNDLAFNSSTGKGGEANVSQNELVTKQITNTLSYTNSFGENFNLNAVVGHEYLKTNFGGNSMFARTFLVTDKPYYYYMSSSDPSTRQTNGFQDPTVELQSFFGRAIFNIKDKYLVTGTVRADGSSKFGSNNRYGIFPSIAAAWNVGAEEFMRNVKQISSLKLRLSYGVTGNQEFPAGASQLTYVLSGNPGNFGQSQIPNPDLKWESNATMNAGLDFAILGGKINASVDYFQKKTKNLLFPRDAADPVPPNSSVKWTNIDGTVVNSGLEFTVNTNIIQKNDFTLGLSLNLTLLKNELKDFVGEIPTGEVSGQGLTGAFAQLLKTGHPLNTFYLKKFMGIDKTTGISSYEGGEQKFFLGSANPKQILGFTINASYKKFNLEASMNGAFGHFIYNNTANAVLAFNNLGKRNIGKSEYNIAVAQGERTVNPTSASSRYLEKGNYLKMANTTLSYNIGPLGKSVKSANVFITGQNLFVITKFTGFDPEVNVSKALNGIPSYGMEYTPYPSARTINIGVNFSF